MRTAHVSPGTIRHRCLSALVIAITFAAPAHAKELWERSWIEVKSPHFVIVSALSEKTTVDLVRDLERFRSAVQIMTNIGRFEERIPTIVYVLPYGVAKLGFTNGVGGYFVPGLRANYAAVIPVPVGDLDDVLKHEYVHFLVHNRDALSYPKWFDEGFAEVLSTITVRGNVIELGQPMGARVEWLVKAPWMPFQQLLDTHDVLKLREHVIPMFYAQSWLLMHYLMNGRPNRNFANDASMYLRLVEIDVKTSDAFEQAFGEPVSKLYLTVSAYINGKLRVLRASLAQPLEDAPTEVLPVAADSIAAQFGELSLQGGEYDEAKRYGDAALALNPNNARALVVIGDYHKFAHRFDEAVPYYERAIALEPHNAQHELDYGEYFLEHANAAKDPDEIARYLTEGRRHFARSYKLDPDDPETLAMNGESYLFPGESADQGLESLATAHAMLPSQAHIRFSLARAYAMSGETEKAKPLLRSLVAWDQSETAEAARKLLAQLSSAKAPDGETARSQTGSQ